MSHNEIFFGDIIKRAKATWIDPVDPIKSPDEWYEAWQKHWLSVARAWRDELSEDDRMKKQLTRLIDYFEGIINERTGQSRNATNTKVDG